MFRRVLDRVGLIPRPTINQPSDLREGGIVAVGQLRCGAPIEAPISRRSCAGFSYRAVFLGHRARRQAARRTLFQAVVYAPELGLQFPDGAVVALVPPTSDECTHESHQALLDRDFPGFKATERLLRTGESVEVSGRAHCRDGEWSIELDRLIQLPASSRRSPR